MSVYIGLSVVGGWQTGTLTAMSVYIGWGLTDWTSYCHACVYWFICGWGLTDSDLLCIHLYRWTIKSSSTFSEGCLVLLLSVSSSLIEYCATVCVWYWASAFWASLWHTGATGQCCSLCLLIHTSWNDSISYIILSTMQGSYWFRWAKHLPVWVFLTDYKYVIPWLGMGPGPGTSKPVT